MNIIQKKMRGMSLNRQGQVQSAKLLCIVNQQQNENFTEQEILSGVFDFAPQNIGSAVKCAVELVNSRTPDVFEVEVDYITVAAAEPDNSKLPSRRHGDRLWSSKCSLYKEKCYETIEKQEQFAADGAICCGAGHSPRWNGKFGEDSSIGAVDKLVPECEESCRKFIFASQCDSKFRKKIMELVGKINKNSFRCWSAKEVMLSKLEISEPFMNDLGESLVEIECCFTIRRHRSNVSWCGIKVGKVHGWDHLWGTFYADPACRDIISNCAYVGKLYESADFGILGLED